VLVLSLFALALMYFRTAGNVAQISKPLSEGDIKSAMMKFSGAYKLKLKFFLIGSPDELLKML